MRELAEGFKGARLFVVLKSGNSSWDPDRYGAKVVLAGGGPVQISERLLPFGHLDVVINLRSDTDGRHVKMWRLLYFHLRAGGIYAVDRSSIMPAAKGEPSLFRRLRDLSAYVSTPPSELATLEEPNKSIAESIESLVIDSDYLIVGKGNTHHLKVRDRVATRMLRRRSGGALQVTPLATKPEGTLTSAGKIVSHAHDPAESAADGLDAQLPYPKLYLRRYEGRLCVGPGGVVHDDSSILPDSFRFHLRADLPQARLNNVDERFARLRLQDLPEKTLPGAYYYLDYSNSGHFGHLMTEGMPKFWGWDIAKRADPDLKILLRIPERYPDRPEPRLENVFLDAYGVDPDDIVWVDEPVWVESLVGATPMWHDAPPFYAHPELKGVWQRIGDALIDDTAPEYERIFVSRPVTYKNRSCRNVAEVERVFAEHGFEILQPQRLSLPQQAGIFSKARVVAGFGGSGMFNLMFARNLETMIVLNHEAYTARNEHLYGVVLGADEHWFWSSPDIGHPDGGALYAAHQSSWEFDFDRNGADLERLLGELG
ncbi:glycosyltransferase family 61 protein [Microlunatus elymi]|uniref:glycosyltransferase family 61 protein n=1 Tax=Microlunatus elymi TaxID=2596828 RepID=UPI00143D0F7A|nr:glycosyltransferase 61 family protein [Microlunatus elymi]